MPPCAPSSRQDPQFRTSVDLPAAGMPTPRDTDDPDGCYPCRAGPMSHANCAASPRWKVSGDGVCEEAPLLLQARRIDQSLAILKRTWDQWRMGAHLRRAPSRSAPSPFSGVGPIKLSSANPPASHHGARTNAIATTRSFGGSGSHPPRCQVTGLHRSAASGRNGEPLAAEADVLSSTVPADSSRA